MILPVDFLSDKIFDCWPPSLRIFLAVSISDQHLLIYQLCTLIEMRFYKWRTLFLLWISFIEIDNKFISWYTES